MVINSGNKRPALVSILHLQEREDFTFRDEGRLRLAVKVSVALVDFRHSFVRQVNQQSIIHEAQL